MVLDDLVADRGSVVEWSSSDGGLELGTRAS